MKNPFLLAALAILSLASCSKDDKCDDWHTGTDCKTEKRTQYLGKYTGTVSFQGDNYGANMTITAGTAINELIADGAVKFTLTDKNSGTFSIAAGTPVNGLVCKSGCGGSFNGNTLTLTLIMDDGLGLNGDGQTYTLTFTGSKN